MVQPLIGGFVIPSRKKTEMYPQWKGPVLVNLKGTIYLRQSCLRWWKTFQTIPEGEKVPDGSQFENCHMVFDIKMKDLHRKAWLVVGCHMMQILNVITYSSVVTRGLYALPLLWQHYMTWKSKQQMFSICMWWHPRKEDMGSARSRAWDHACKSAVIVRALCGLKSAGGSFRAHLAVLFMYSILCGWHS